MKNLFFALLVLSAQVVAAQDFEQVSGTNGFYAGAGIGSTGWSSETFSGDEFLGGFASYIETGYGFSEKLTAFFRFEFGSNLSSGNPSIAPYPSRQIELGARWNFLSSTQSFRPFFQVTGSRYSINFESFDIFGNFLPVKASGVLIGIGGGARYFFNPAFSVVGQLQSDFGSFNSVTVSGLDLMESHGLFTFRFNIGATFHLSGL